ncbi:hypothetical protein V7O66_02920 [Methanolobus sp. ZRKC3]|uniref:hypothetical protein n=1 Tax=Methanolobus sp. ZRKC3 TaxID=3125786 RepID=UPI00324A00CE
MIPPMRNLLGIVGGSVCYLARPVYVGKRDDTDLLRKKIIDMSYTEWKKMGFSKGTLHYMKQNARCEMPFTLNAHVRERLEKWENKKYCD